MIIIMIEIVIIIIIIFGLRGMDMNFAPVTNATVTE